jgi:hypothetical protein
MLENVCFVVPGLQYLYLNIIANSQKNKKINKILKNL